VSERKISSGQIPLINGHVFKWYNDEGAEVYGWTENDERMIVKGSSGWFRTTDPELAAKVALSNLQAG